MEVIQLPSGKIFKNDKEPQKPGDPPKGIWSVVYGQLTFKITRMEKK